MTDDRSYEVDDGKKPSTATGESKDRLEEKGE